MQTTAKRSPEPDCGMQRRLEPLVEHGPVRQIGQRVVKRKMRDALFGALALRDILDHGQHELRAAFIVFQKFSGESDDARLLSAKSRLCDRR